MSIFDREVPVCRLVSTHHGDTMQRVAARELGDANLWPDLVWINNLTYPYLTDDPERVTASVLLTGSVIKVPAPVGVFTESADKGAIYERDCALTQRRLTVDAGGDIAVAVGVDNLKQQLTHVVVTPTGQASRHPTYGCKAWRLLGTASGPVAAKLGSEYVRSSLASDYRVSFVDYSLAEILGDTLKITARAVAVEGSAINVTT